MMLWMNTQVVRPFSFRKIKRRLITVELFMFQCQGRRSILGIKRNYREGRGLWQELRFCRLLILLEGWVLWSLMSLMPFWMQGTHLDFSGLSGICRFIMRFRLLLLPISTGFIKMLSHWWELLLRLKNWLLSAFQWTSDKKKKIKSSTDQTNVNNLIELKI